MKTQDYAFQALQQAVELAGGIRPLSVRIGVSYQAVQQWLARGKVPPERVLDVEGAVQGQVSCYELAPDVYPRSRFVEGKLRIPAAMLRDVA